MFGLDPLLVTFIPAAFFDFGGALTFVVPALWILLLLVFDILDFGGGFQVVATL
jgi:hypothetical protein